MLIIGSRAADGCEPCQVRKEAAVSSAVWVPRGCPIGVNCKSNACKMCVRGGCAAFYLYFDFSTAKTGNTSGLWIPQCISFLILEDTMEHLALYRKWRPQNFNALIGQDDNVRVLKNAVAQGRTVHAYLFCGTRGTGKTSTARILAKVLNCEHPVDGEPCNECEICRAITEGSFMDVIEIDAASNRGIDEVRDLLEKVHFVPVKGKYKVYIIDEAHMLTTEAFNALLKTFEEPPSHVVFILATTEARKVPLTILSRCQRYDFKSISENTLIEALSRIADAEGVDAEEDAIALLAEKARGSMRDALSLMDQAMGSEKVMTAAELNRLTGSVPYEFWADFFRSIAQNNLPAVFSALDGIEKDGKDLRQFFRDFRDFAGDLIGSSVADGKNRYQQILKECSGLFSPQQILEMVTVCGESEIIFRYNRDGKAVCRFLMARIMKALYPVVASAAPSVPMEAAPPKQAENMPAYEDIPFPTEAPPEEEPPMAEAFTEAPRKKSAAAAPKKLQRQDDFVFPNETIGVEPPTKTEPKSATQRPEDIPPWETIPDLSFSSLSDASEEKPVAKAKEMPLPKKEMLPSEPVMPKASAGESTLTASAEDDMDCEVLRSKLLKEVREKSASTFTWLSHGELSEISGNDVIFTYNSHDGLFLDKVKEPNHTKVIEAALKQITGRAMRFLPRFAAGTQNEELSLF